MSEDKNKGPVQLFICGGDQCPVDKKPHTWDGPEYVTENCNSSTCSKCGLAAIDWSLMNAP